MYKNLFIKLLFLFLLVSCQVLKPKSFLLKSNQEKALYYSRNINKSIKKTFIYISFDNLKVEKPLHLVKKVAKYIEEHFKNTKVAPV